MAEEPQATRRRFFEPKPALIGWLGLAAVILVGGAGILLGRDAITAAWPAAARLYGLPAQDPASGLELRNVSSSRRDEAGTSTLVLEGTIANLSGKTLPVPLLLAVLHDGKKQNLKYWTFPAPVRSLEPGGTASFRGELPDPPAGASDISVTFTAN